MSVLVQVFHPIYIENMYYWHYTKTSNMCRCQAVVIVRWDLLLTKITYPLLLGRGTSSRVDAVIRDPKMFWNNIIIKSTFHREQRLGHRPINRTKSQQAWQRIFFQKCHWGGTLLDKWSPLKWVAVISSVQKVMAKQNNEDKEVNKIELR